MDTNLGKKMPQIRWDVTTKHQLTKPQKEILKDYFKNGPSLRSELSKKLGKEKRGESYNKNLDKLVYLNQLKHKEHFKEISNLKHTDTSMIEDPKLRKAIKKAFEKKDFGRPRSFTKKKWEDACREFQLENYNEPINGKIGESLYSLTIWGIVAHLRNEGKLDQKTRVLFASKEDKEEYQSQPIVSDDDLDLVLKHFSDNFRLIARKWDYLCKNNDSNIVYHQLFHSLCLANYYYEMLNADFEGFENSALDDIKMNFFIPSTLSPENAEKWMRVIVKDNEIYDYISGCFMDLQQNYKKNQEIVTEYKKTLDSFRNSKNKRKSKFFKESDFFVKVPTSRKGGKKHHYLKNGYGGYHLSNFLNVLDFGPLDYRLSFVEELHWHRKKHRQTRK